MVVRTISGHKGFELRGDVTVPGDKSICHRALILGAMARGRTFIKGAPLNRDVAATIRVLKALGVSVEQAGTSISVEGVGKGRFKMPSGPLDCGGSATTMRLMMGALAGKGPTNTLDGDATLRARPMRRVMEPLMQMGTEFEPAQGEFAPILMVPPAQPRALDYEMPVASAQVKTALILAALCADGRSVIRGAVGSRDHTERLAPRMGGRIVSTKDALITEPSALDAIAINVPGDTSTAAFFAAAAALGRNSLLNLRGICVNPTRMGFFEALSWMGCKLHTEEAADSSYEPYGDVNVRWAPLKAIQIHPEAVPYLVDEVPLVMLLATQADGLSVLRGVGELRLKETDRIRCAVAGLRSMGASIEVTEDTVAISGPTPLRAATLDPCGDHRMSMMFTLAAYAASGTSTILNVDCEEKSCPEFYDLFQRVLKR